MKAGSVEITDDLADARRNERGNRRGHQSVRQKRLIDLDRATVRQVPLRLHLPTDVGHDRSVLPHDPRDHLSDVIERQRRQGLKRGDRTAGTWGGH